MEVNNLTKSEKDSLHNEFDGAIKNNDFDKVLNLILDNISKLNNNLFHIDGSYNTT